MIKKGNEILDFDFIEFIPGTLYYYFCPIPKTTKDLKINVK
jgi:hypothetical protein